MAILVESAIRVTVLALGVAVVLRALRIRSPRLAHGAWTAVIVVMVLLPVFVALGPAFAIPVLPSHTADAVLAPDAGDIAPAKPRNVPMAATRATDPAQAGVTWRAAVMAVYLAGVAILLMRLAIGLRRARAIRHGAIEALGRLTHASCVTPMTIGIIAPAIVLPPDWAEWNGVELSAILAHEEAHVRRRDPLVAAVALVNRAVFWFHPLAWWLHREISRLSEQACDAVVIASGHDGDVYSTCLVRFARRAHNAGGRLAPLATMMPGAGLPERLRKLAHPQAASPSGLRLACAALACAALVAVCAAAAPTAAPLQNPPSAGRGQATWLVHTSEHFEIFHDRLPIDRVTEAAREAEAAYAQLNGAFKYDMPQRVPIMLVPRDRDLGGALLQGGAVRTTGALAQRRVVISLESLDRRDGIVVHELTHQFAFEIVPETSRVVPVLIEGLAEHQRGVWRADDVRVTRDAIAAGAIPPLANLVAGDRHWAHALFDFVAAQHEAEGVRRLLFALRSRDTLAPAVPMAFGVTLDQFNQQFRGYLTTVFGNPDRR
jgi:beta-lactamase regulating signal transducer with metallopeptidase domain